MGSRKTQNRKEKKSSHARPGIPKFKATMKEFTLENVRCFEGRHKFQIRPLTFLVGENSTGKSTVLGCVQALMDFYTSSNSMFNHNINFNNLPYAMGSFSDIVRRSNKTAKTFKLGFSFGNEQDSASSKKITIVEKKGGFEPVLQREEWEFADGKIVFELNNDDEKGDDKPLIKYKKSNGKEEFLIRFQSSFLGNAIKVILAWSTPNAKMLWKFLKKHRIREFVKAESFAPIRTKPKRTYDPLKEDKGPEGGDMPMVVMNMSRLNKQKWKNIENRLKKFGESSGLFSAISVQSSKEMGGAFQLKIKVQGSSVNMVDVGYGVSQILPILVRIFTEKEKKIFLLQQPEVHLHPRAQAELSLLLAQIAHQEDGHNFLIETHSDYMIDRARIEIAQKNIRAEDVALIYLEHKDNKTVVHNISFDENAEMKEVPKSYRQFFMQETGKLLGFD